MTRHPHPKLRIVSVGLFLLISFLVSFKSSAQSLGSGTGRGGTPGWDYRLTAESISDSAIPNRFVYNDGFYGGWNCRSRFF